MSESYSIITGASRGIGKAIALKLAKEGHNLIICSKDREKLLDLKDELLDKYEIGVSAYAADLSDVKQIKAFGDYINFSKPRINILVNNAGVFMPGTILTEPDGNLETMLNTNILSAYYCSKMFVNAMKGNYKAHIFNVCSIASIKAYPQSGSYSISKFGMLALSKSLREELTSTNIRVTAILPGATLTDSWAGVDIPEDRFMTPTDIADILWATWQLHDNAVVEEIVIRPLRGDV